jgi:hypothetical protein
MFKVGVGVYLYVSGNWDSLAEWKKMSLSGLHQALHVFVLK